MIEKECVSCKKVKLRSEYHRSTRGKGGMYSYCKDCARAAKKEYTRSTISVTHRSRRNSSKKKGVPYEFSHWLELQDAVGYPDGESCPICKVEMRFTTSGDSNKPNAPSLDEIVPGMGYRRLENGSLTCWWICSTCNKRKRDSTPEEMYQIADAVFAERRKRGLE